jgi:hypothetical protein
MKAILFLFLVSSVYGQEIKPVKGVYYCKKGNEESICDQILKPVYVEERLSAISVEYVGWCGSMGPYLYPCIGNTCYDIGIEIIFRDERHYRWENKQYKFICEFEKK